MDTFIVIVVSGAGIVALWLMLERTHRRTEHLSRTPFRADLEGDRDISRTLAEIDAVRSRQPRVAPQRPPASSTDRSCRQCPDHKPGASHLRSV